MHSPSLPPRASLDTVCIRVNALLAQSPYDTISAALGGGIERLIMVMEGAGWDALGEECDFDCALTTEGRQVLLVHVTGPDMQGQWGALWRSEWNWADLRVGQAEPLMRTLDAGVKRLRSQCGLASAPADVQSA